METGNGIDGLNGAAKISPYLREYAERLIAGEPQLQAWCAARGCEPSPAASASASRAKNGAAFNAYMAELEARAKQAGVPVSSVGGEAALKSLEEKKRMLSAALMSREECMRYLCEVIMTSPWDLICRDPESEHFGKPDPAKGHLCQKVKISDGEITLELPSKNEAMRMFLAMAPEEKSGNSEAAFHRVRELEEKRIADNPRLAMR